MIEESKIAKAKELTETLEELNRCKNLLQNEDAHLNIVAGYECTEPYKPITQCFPNVLIPEVGKILEKRITEVWTELQKLVCPDRFLIEQASDK